VLVASTLGGVREDIIGPLSIFLGPSRANELVTNLEALIRTEAKTGAEEAIPTIRTEVQATVRPFVIAAVILGGVGAVAGSYALYRTTR
jgi:hypothetical protein